MKHSRLWLISLIAALVIVLLSVTVAAETAIIDSGTCGDSLTWALYEDGVLEIAGEGEMEDYDGTGTAPWYSYRDLITSVVIGENVTSIGDYAFSRCSSLSGELYIPGNVLSIGEGAFFECTGFTALTLSDGVTSLGESAFDGCSGMEGSLVLPDSVKTMRDLTFYRCTGFDSLILSNELTHIPDGAFSGCTGLTSVVFGEKTSIIGEFAFVDCTSLTELEFPEGLNYIYLEAFRGCTGLEKVSFPSTLQRIDGRAFSGCSNLKTVFFAGDAPTGDETVFYGCNKELVLYVKSGANGWASSMWGIPTRIITDMRACGDNLTWTLYEDGLLEINGTGDMWDFYWHDIDSPDCSPWLKYRASITELKITEGVTSIGDYAFYVCDSIKGTLTLPTSLTRIGERAFYRCDGLTGDLHIGDSVTSIGDYAFWRCYGFDGNLYISRSLTEIGTGVFRECEGLVGSLIIPDNVKSIGMSAFLSCSGFTGNITLPKSLVTIGQSAFEMCSGISGDLIIPETTSNIDNRAFRGCSEIESVVFCGESPRMGTQVFERCSGLDAIYCYNEYIDSFRESEYYNRHNNTWCDYPIYPIDPVDGIIESGVCGDNLTWSLNEDGTLEINGTGNMWDFNNEDVKAPWMKHRSIIKKLKLPDGITSIGAYSFFLCESLEGDLVLPNEITYIADSAFYGCRKLNGDLIFPDSIIEIGRRAFDQCGFDGRIELGSSLEIIRSNAFFGVSKLVGDLYIPDSVRIIEGNAFQGCVGISSIRISENEELTELCSKVFESMYGITGHVKIPDNIKTIGYATFAHCRNISSVEMAVNEIDYLAFWDCQSLNDVYISCDAPIIDIESFSKGQHPVVHYYCFTAGWDDIEWKSYELIQIHSDVLRLVDAKYPLCESSGNIEYYVCDLCGSLFEDIDGTKPINDEEGIMIPALGHDWSDWSIVTEATTEHEGMERRTCSRCDAEDTRTIPKLQKPETEPDIPDNNQSYDFIGAALRRAAEQRRIDELRRQAEQEQPTIPQVADTWINPFRDILPEDRIYNAVRFVNENGIFIGMTEDEFQPGRSMSRAMFVTVLGRYCGVDVSRYGVPTFKDVQPGEWYTPYVAWAQEAGIIKGYNADTFGIDDPVTVEQTAVILERFARYIGANTAGEGISLDKHADADDVSEWAREGMVFVISHGIYGDSANLTPKEYASRGLLAEMLYKLYENFMLE